MQGGRIIGQLSHQLDTWRLLLPEDLRWDDDLRMVRTCTLNDAKFLADSPHSSYR